MEKPWPIGGAFFWGMIVRDKTSIRRRKHSAGNEVFSEFTWIHKEELRIFERKKEHEVNMSSLKGEL